MEIIFYIWLISWFLCGFLGWLGGYYSLRYNFLINELDWDNSDTKRITLKQAWRIIQGPFLLGWTMCWCATKEIDFIIYSKTPIKSGVPESIVPMWINKD